MRVDMGDYQSVKAFANVMKAEVPIVDFLVLNAGIGTIKLERSLSGHENMTQVNCLSNVLLTVELIPHLEASAEKAGATARITWVGELQTPQADLCAEGSDRAPRDCSRPHG